MIRFKCPKCSSVFELDDSLIGRKAACSMCQTRFRVPSPMSDGSIPVAATILSAPPSAPAPIPNSAPAAPAPLAPNPAPVPKPATGPVIKPPTPVAGDSAPAVAASKPLHSTTSQTTTRGNAKKLKVFASGKTPAGGTPIPSTKASSAAPTTAASSTDDGATTWITCPHCWRRFDIREMNYVSRHIDLMGDPILGPEAQQRFLPFKFSAKGLALDARGLECPEMACPHCHLKILETMIDQPMSFFSIVGSPASGKSYFLTSMLWNIRRLLPLRFDLTLGDLDTTMNSVLTKYQETLFLNLHPDQPVALPKTELAGVGYSNQVLLEGMAVDLPSPFVFGMSPEPSHPHYKTQQDILNRNIILYDNAGEHFEPGRESFNNLATLHLLHADGIIFLIDPLQDARLRSHCKESDPQYQQESSSNQLELLYEMISRIRRFTGLHANEKFRQPLVMVLGKFDAIRDELGIALNNDDVLHYDREKMEYSLNLQNITNVSFQVREWLLRHTPELVTAAENFSETVYFVPVSAFGCSPEVISSPSQPGAKPVLGIRPDHIQPLWIEVPLLLQLYLHGLIPGSVCAPESFQEVTEYRFKQDILQFVLPGQDERKEVPPLYAGYYIRNAADGEYYRLPPAEKSPAPQEATGGHQASRLDRKIDVDFWKS